MRGARPTQNAAGQILYRTRGQDLPPLTLGPRRMHYQYSVALPLIHLTFVSIVQGIALGVLLEGIPLPAGKSVWSVLAYAAAQYVYLPYLISCLLILVIWKQFVQASLFYVWPLSTLQLGLILLISVVEIIAFREVNNFGVWLACLGVVAIVGGAIRLNNLRIRSSGHFEQRTTMSDATRIEVQSGLVYAVIGLAIIGAVLAYLNLPVMANYARAIHWAVLGFLVLIMFVVIALDQHHMKRMVDNVLVGSDLEATEVGGLRYRT